MVNQSAAAEKVVVPEESSHLVCSACGQPGLGAYGSVKTLPISRCSSCRFQWQSPQPSDDQLAEIYGTYYFIGSEDEQSRERKLRIKQLTARLYLDMIDEHVRLSQDNTASPGALLEVGSGQGEFLCEALRRGYVVTGVEYSHNACSSARTSLASLNPACDRFRVEQGALEAVNLSAGSFDVCVMNDVIEHVRDPKSTLKRVRELLKPGGSLFIATPSLDSWSAKLMGRLWMEYKQEHLFFFSNDALTKMLKNCGFSAVTLRPGYKVLTLEYVAQHFEKFPVPGFSPLVRGVVGLLPTSLARRPIKIVASGVIAIAAAG